MNNALNKLVEEHGAENVFTAAKQILNGKIDSQSDSGYAGLIQPDKVQESVSLIENALRDVTEAGKAVEEAYGDRRSLVKQISQLETSIELTEAEAFMQLEGNKVEVDGKTITLSNDKMRDMYRKYSSREERKQRAELESELKAIEISTYKAKDRWEEAKLSADLVKSRAYVQANLLEFLS